MKTFISKQLLPPNGHYSHAVIHHDVAYFSGILPVKKIADQVTVVSADIEKQTLTCFETLRVLLEELSLNPSQVIKMNIYLADIDLWDEVNKLYKTFFVEHRPARTVIPTTMLHFNCLIEIDCIVAMN